MTRFIFAMMAMVLAGCSEPLEDLGPRKVSLDDPQVQPFLKAMERVDRASLGFSPLTTNSDVRLEVAHGRDYDAMLHVYGETRRTIGFQKEGSGYRWISEQETYDGPDWVQSIDGNFRESIKLEYQTEKVNGIPTNQFWISYSGGDSKFYGHVLTLSEVKPILEEWKNTPVKPRPPDLPGSDFPDPMPFFLFLCFVFVVVIIFVVCCLLTCLAFIAFGICSALGIISTSVLLGVVKRNVGTGIRAFFLQLGAAVGMLSGAAGIAILNLISKHYYWNSAPRWLTGVAIGLVTGLIFGWLFNKAWGRIVKVLTGWLTRKGLKNATQKKAES